MSLAAAVAELNKEIATLDKTISEAQRTKTRLEGHRDALLKEDGAGSSDTAVKRGKPGPKPGQAAKKAAAVKKAAGAKKAVTAKKTVPAKKTAVSKKRTMSPEAKKRIGDAVRKRWADKKAAAKS